MYAAENTRYVIFAANGPEVASVGKLDGVEITDIMLTILAAYGVDIPTDTVDKFLDIFGEEPDIKSQDLITINRTNIARNQEVADRLTKLGYME